MLGVPRGVGRWKTPGHGAGSSGSPELEKLSRKGRTLCPLWQNPLSKPWSMLCKASGVPAALTAPCAFRAGSSPPNFHGLAVFPCLVSPAHPPSSRRGGEGAGVPQLWSLTPRFLSWGKNLPPAAARALTRIMSPAAIGFSRKFPLSDVIDLDSPQSWFPGTNGCWKRSPGDRKSMGKQAA